MDFSFPYRTRVAEEAFGSTSLRIERLADLNETIDRLFEELERTGQGELLEEYCPYFGVVWPAARALALECEARIPEGARVLEIGCGLAVPSLLLARRGCRATATDAHRDVPAFLARNRAHNDLADGPEFARLDWRGREPQPGRWDWVIASDVLYEKRMPHELASFMADLRAGANPPQFLVTDPGRPYLQAFADALAGRGIPATLDARRVAAPDDSPEGTRDVFILHVD